MTKGIVTPFTPRSQSSVPDPHVAWAREAEAIIARLDTPGLLADEGTAPLCHRQSALENRICTTRARTLAGVREQIALVARSIRHNQPGGREDAALENVLATLERLVGRA